MGKMLEQMNFFAAATVIATTVLTVMFFFYYAQKKLPPEGTDELDRFWYMGLFAAELYGQFTTQKALTAGDAVSVTLLNVVMNIVLFFICYGILSVAGVDKENLYNRCKKAFMGLVIVSVALMALFDHFVGTQPASQNVPAVNQKTHWEFVINLDGEDIYIDRKSLKRIGNTHPDAAPEFKCVLLDASGVPQNCEFRARGVVVMFVEGIRIGDSTEEPAIGEIYDAIVAKFL